MAKIPWRFVKALCIYAHTWQVGVYRTKPTVDGIISKKCSLLSGDLRNKCPRMYSVQECIYSEAIHKRRVGTSGVTKQDL